METARHVGIILLAAGNSTRMGRLKQLLPYRGVTLLRHAARTALDTGRAPVLVVLGAEAEPCRAEIAGLPLQTVLNPDWAEGMGTSVRTGIEELVRIAPHVQAVLIMLHDQPLITAPQLRDLVAAGGSALGPVASLYDGTLGVPALFPRELFAELLALSGHQGARRVLETHRERVLTFDLPEAMQDVDTPADYQRLPG